MESSDLGVCLLCPLSYFEKRFSGRFFSQAQRGLCLVDPLSLFLFVIVGEALSCMVIVSNASLSNGLKLVPNAPTITHLQFTVDTLIFYDAKEDPNQEYQGSLYVLKLYQTSSPFFSEADSFG